MNKKSLIALPALLMFASLSVFPQQLSAHCQVPCGIFTDQLRFEAMLEDTTTIAKAIDQVGENLAAMESEATPLIVNQLSRWVATKEEHANHIQKVIADYFMAQRIKPGEAGDKAAHEAYVKKLTAAHAVMQAAMKVKQDASADKADALKSAILDFYRAYEGKEPKFD